MPGLDMAPTRTENSTDFSPVPPISWRTDIAGVIGITLIVMVLLWPALDGSHSLMSDSWKLNYPWAVEGSLESTAFEENFPDSAIDPGSRDEPYVLAYDIYLENIPWYKFAQEEIRSGRFPHWNPYSFNGAPFYANHLVPLTHPPLIIALLISPLHQVHTVATFLTLWLAGIGLYFYLRSKRLQPVAGIASAAIYLTIGHFMPLVPFQMAGLMYYPWLMWASDNLDLKPSFRTLLPFTLILGLQLAAGHPAYVAPFLYMIILHRILLWIFRSKPKSYWLPRLGILAVAFVLGFAISAVQNYPTWNFLKLSARDLNGQTERTMHNHSDSEQIIQAAGITRSDNEPMNAKFSVLFAPVFQRQIEKQHPYVGIPLLILAILGLILIRPPPDRRAMGILLLLFIILAAPPVFRSIGQFIPGLGISPFNPYAPAQFLLVILAGYGINGLIERGREIPKTWRVVISACTILGLLLFVVPFIQNALAGPSTRWAQDQVLLGYLVLVTGIIAILAPLAAVLPRKKSNVIGGLLMPLAITVSGVLGHFYQYPVFQRNPVMPETQSIAALPPTNMYRVIRHSSKPAAHAGSMDNPLTFGGNLPMWAGMLDSQGYDSLVLQDQWDMLKELDPNSLAWNGLALPVTDPDALNSSILDAMAVKYIISDDPSLSESHPDLTLLHSGGFMIYEREPANPRWYLTVDPANGNQVSSDLNAYSPGRITMVKEIPTKIEFSVDADTDCWMVLSDTWHPQWVAEMGGVEVEILKANNAYRTLRIPQGEHMLIFRYFPKDFLIGLYISTFILIILMGGAILELIQHRTNRVNLSK